MNKFNSDFGGDFGDFSGDFGDFSGDFGDSGDFSKSSDPKFDSDKINLLHVHGHVNLSFYKNGSTNMRQNAFKVSFTDT